MAVDSGSIFSEVRIQIDKLRGDIKQVQLTMDKLGPISKKSSDTVAKNWTKGFNQIKFVSAAAFAAVGMAVKAAVSTFAGFEQSLANVQSVARATDEEFERLSDAAKEAGETTRFTASQAADALYYLASAGMDATESIDALDGVLNLAGATQSDLAYTSATVASALSQFNLDAGDASRVANVFTASIQNSQATMHKLGTSMAIVGPVASGLGHTIEQTAGALQILYNNGLDASMAGTALRGALADLANEMSPAVARLKEMGVAYDEVNPATNTFADVVTRLGEAGLEAGEIMAIFGKRAGPAMIKLIEAGGEAIDEYTDAVTDTNAAAEAYAVQNDTLAGSFDRLKSATESAQISFISNVEPMLRGITDLLTGVVKLVGGLPGPIQVLLGVIAVGIPTVLAAGSAIAFMTTALAGAGVALGTILGPVTLIVGGIGLLAAGVVEVSSKIRESREEWEHYRELIDDTAEAVKGLTYEQQLNERALLMSRLNKVNRDALPILAELTRERRLQAEALDGLAESGMNEADQAEAARRSNEEFARTVGVLQENLKLATDEAETLTTAIGEIDRVMEESSERTTTLTEDLEDQGETVRELSERIRLWRELQRSTGKVSEEKAEQLRRLAVLESQAAENRQEEYDDREHLRDLNLRTLAAEKNVQAERDRLNAERIAGMDMVAEEEARLADQSAAGVVASVDAARARIELAEEEQRAAEEALKAEEKRAEAAEKQIAAQATADTLMEEYDQKLLQLTGSQEDLFEAEQARVAETLFAAGVSVEAIQDVIDKVEEYHNALRDDRAAKEFEQAIKDATDLAFDYVEQLGDLLLDIIEATTDRRIAEVDRQLQAELEANGLAEESTVERYQRELDEARETGDAEAVLLAENNLRRAQIEQDYERRRAQIEYEGAMSSWKIQLIMTIAQAFQAALNAYSSTAAIPVVGPVLAPIAAAIAAAFGTKQVGLVREAEPQPPALATGAIVLPSSGGVPTVQAENGYPELSMNAGPEGRALRRMFARDIAEQIGGGSLLVQLDIDGLRIAEVMAERVNNGQVRLKI